MSNLDDAEDLRQEICRCCVRSRPRFRGVADFRTWIYRIAINVGKNALRARARRREALQTELGDVRFADLVRMLAESREAEDAPDPLVERALIGLAQLTEYQRQLLTWKYFEGLTHAEIATRRGIKPSSASQAVHHALAALRRKCVAVAEGGSLEVLARSTSPPIAPGESP